MSSERGFESAAALALVAAVTVAGCGGGPQDVNAEELVAEGDEICRLGQERFDEIQEDPPANASEAVEQTELLIQESEDELNALRDLEPPDELRESYDRYLEARGRALEFLRRGRDAAEKQDSQAYLEAQTGVAKRAKERQTLAQAVGFQVCSKTPAA
jgi:hypothetical protein